jgi:hypothetical protein
MIHLTTNTRLTRIAALVATAMSIAVVNGKIWM